MSGCEIRLWRPDRDNGISVMLSGNVRHYAVRAAFITGYADTECLDLSGEPEAKRGYFLIDTRSDSVTYGMDESHWRKELQKVAWTNPELQQLH